MRGDKEETRENYRLLKSSGCVIHRENGDVEVLSAEEASTESDAMDPAHKKLQTEKH